MPLPAPQPNTLRGLGLDVGGGTEAPEAGEATKMNAEGPRGLGQVSHYHIGGNV